MKKTLGALLCAAALLFSLCVPALAAEDHPPLAEDFDALLGDSALSGIQGGIMPISLPAKQGGFRLMVNGSFVSFPDAVPVLKDGRSFLPFAATFEQLGFEAENMTWDGATKTVTAAREDGLTVSLTVGKKEIVVSDPDVGDEQTSYEIDVAPYIDPAASRTYVPIGLIASVLDGYKVGWDGSSKTVVVENVAAALAANTETYELMDQYMAYAGKYAQGNWQQTGKYSLELNVAGEGDMAGTGKTSTTDLTLTAGGTYQSLTEGDRAFQFSTGLTMDYRLTLNGEDAAGLTSALMGEDFPEFPLDVDLEMRGDRETGTFYLHSGTLDSPIGGTDGEKEVWYKLDMAKLWDKAYGSLGIDWATLQEMSRSQSEKTFGEVLEGIVLAMPITPYRTAAGSLAQLNALFGDSAFVKEGTTYVNDLSKTIPAGTDAAMRMVLYTSDGKVSGIGVEMSAGTSAGDPVELTMELSAEQKDDKMQMDLGIWFGADRGDSPFRLSLTMNMDGAVTAVSGLPGYLFRPPADAEVVDLDWTGVTAVPEASLGIIGGADGPTAIITTPIQ